MRSHISISTEDKVYQPVVQSNLKFAAYGHKFLKNYQHSIVKFVRRINEMQFDSYEDEKKAHDYRLWIMRHL